MLIRNDLLVEPMNSPAQTVYYWIAVPRYNATAEGRSQKKMETLH